MPDPRRRIYWDSCVFLHYLAGTAAYSGILESLLEQASRGDEIEILTSTLSITEVAFVAQEKAGGLLQGPGEAAIDDLWADRSAVTLVEFDQFVARNGRDLLRQSAVASASLRSADAVQLATARTVRAVEFHTTDGKLIALASKLVLPFKVGLPTTTKPKLF